MDIPKEHDDDDEDDDFETVFDEGDQSLVLEQNFLQ